MTTDATSETPVGVAVDGAGNVYVLDAKTSRIEKFTASGKLIARWGFGNPEMTQQPNRSVGMSVDGAGNVYLLDAEAARIQKNSPTGQFIGAWGFGAPEVNNAGSSRASGDAPVAQPKEAAPVPSASPSTGTEMTPDAGPVVEPLKQTVTTAPAVDMVQSTISGVASAPGAAVGKGVDAVKSATSGVASAPGAAVGKGVDAVKSATSGVTSVPGAAVDKGADAVKSATSGAAAVSAPVTDTVGKGFEKIKTAGSDVIRGKGDGMKNPLRSGEASETKHHWWQFWK